MPANNTAGSQLCPGCRKLISRSTGRCPYCGLNQPTSKWKNMFLAAGPDAAERLVTVLIAVNAAMLLLALAIDPRSSSLSLSPFGFLAPTNQSLLVLGSTGTIPLFQLHRWWSLVAAGYLHGGLLHLVFNMLALRQLAPLMVLEYGLNRTIILYTAGSIGGFLISGLAGVPFTIGASAAVCSLIGALLYYGRNRGGIYGRNIFSQIGGWALGIALFGFMVPGINNWGHGGGMVAGALLGYLLGYQENRKETLSHRFLALGCAIGTALILVWSCLNGLALLLIRG